MLSEHDERLRERIELHLTHIQDVKRIARLEQENAALRAQVARLKAMKTWLQEGFRDIKEGVADPVQYARETLSGPAPGVLEKIITAYGNAFARASADPVRVAETNTVCPYCGPECQRGAAHNARVEDGVFNRAAKTKEGK